MQMMNANEWPRSLSFRLVRALNSHKSDLVAARGQLERLGTPLATQQEARGILREFR